MNTALAAILKATIFILSVFRTSLPLSIRNQSYYLHRLRWEDKTDMALPWEQHKGTIERLYLSEKKTLKQVMIFMKHQHGFDVTKGIYERQFKKWDFVKYNLKDVTVEQWQAIGEKVRKRKRAGKESEVFLDGEVVPTKKVHREIARKGFVSTIEKYQSARSPKTPEGVLIHTPPSEAYDGLVIDLIWPLPCIRFQTLFQSLAAPLNNGLSKNPSKITDSMHPRLNFLGSIRRDFTFPITHLFRNSRTCDLFAAFIPPKDFEVGNVLMPKSRSDGLTKPDSVHILKFVIYALSNKVSHFELREACEQLALEWCRCPGNLQTLESVLESREPTATAFAETMLGPAMESQDHNLVKVILSSGVQFNSTIIRIAASEGNVELTKHILENRPEIFEHHSADLRIALSKAVRSGSLDLVRLLLEVGASPYVNYVFKQIAIHKGDLEMNRLLIQAGADINLREPGSWSCPLEIAVSCQLHQTTQLLINLGANVNSFNYEVPSALELAIQMEDRPMFDLLRDAGAHFDSAGGDRGALPTAVAGINQVLVEALLDSGAGVNALDHFGETALTRAIKKKDLGMFHYLLGFGADINKVGEWNPRQNKPCTPLRAAVGMGDDTITQLLLEYGASSIDSDLVLLAIRMKKRWLLRCLLDQGLDLNDTIEDEKILTKFGIRTAYTTPLKAAVRTNDTTMTAMILAWNASPIDPTALSAAVWNSSIRSVEILLEAISRINHEYDTANLYSPAIAEAVASTCDPEIIRRLVCAGGDLNRRYFFRNHFSGVDEERFATPFEFAVQEGHIFVAQLLLDLGANPNISFDSGRGISAAARATRRGDIGLLKLLLRYEVDLNAAPCRKAYQERYYETDGGCLIIEQSDYSVLQCAVLTGQAEMVRFLLDSGAMIQGPLGIRGLTALHLAASEGYIEIVKTLLQEGAVTIIDFVSSGFSWSHHESRDICSNSYRFHRTRTALELASENGRIDMVQLLLNAGAALELPRPRKTSFERDHEPHHDAGTEGQDWREERRIWEDQHVLAWLCYCDEDEQEEQGLPGDTQYEIAKGLAQREGHWAIARLLTAFKEERERNVL